MAVTRFGYRVLLPLFVLSVGAWVHLSGVNGFLSTDSLFDLTFAFGTFVTMPLQYHFGWSIVLLSPFAALVLLHWAAYRINRNSRFRNVALGLALSVCLFAVLNWFNALRPVTCYDCFFRYGVPFTFYREGGFAGGGGIVWIGVLGSAIAVFSTGAVIDWAISRLRSRTRPS